MLWITSVPHILQGIRQIFGKFSENFGFFAFQLKCSSRIPEQSLCSAPLLCLDPQQTLRMDYLTLKIIYKFPISKSLFIHFSPIFIFNQLIFIQKQAIINYPSTYHLAPTSAMNFAYNNVSFLFSMFAIAINDPRLTMININPKKNLRM